jgi:hypothetical protein
VPRTADHDLRRLDELGPRPARLFRMGRERGQGVDRRERRGGAQQGGDVRSEIGDQAVEQVLLAPERPLARR